MKNQCDGKAPNNWHHSNSDCGIGLVAESESEFLCLATSLWQWEAGQGRKQCLLYRLEKSEKDQFACWAW